MNLKELYETSNEVWKQMVISKAHTEAKKHNFKIDWILKNATCLTPQIIRNCIQAKSDLTKLFKKYKVNIKQTNTDYLEDPMLFRRLALSPKQMKINQIYNIKLDVGEYDFDWTYLDDTLLRKWSSDENNICIFESIYEFSPWIHLYYLNYNPRDNSYSIKDISFNMKDEDASIMSKLIQAEFRKIWIQYEVDIHNHIISIRPLAWDKWFDIKTINSIFGVIDNLEVSQLIEGLIQSGLAKRSK